MKKINKNIRLGDLLVKSGVISQSHLKLALKEQQRWGGKLGAILLQMDLISEDLLLKALNKLLNIPIIDISTITIPPAILDKVDADYAIEHVVLPIKVDSNNALLLAMTDPTDYNVIEELTFSTGLQIHPRLSTESQLRNAIKRHYFKTSEYDDSMDDYSGESSDFEIQQTPKFNIVDSGGRLIDTDKEITAEHFQMQEEKVNTLEKEILNKIKLLTSKINQIENVQNKHGNALKAIFNLLLKKQIITAKEYSLELKKSKK